MGCLATTCMAHSAKDKPKAGPWNFQGPDAFLLHRSKDWAARTECLSACTEFVMSVGFQKSYCQVVNSNLIAYKDKGWQVIHNHA